MFVKLRWVTPNPEFEIAYIARGSNPPNQDNPEYRKLFQYCLARPKLKHWSPFQMSSMCIQVETSLFVAAQIKRHWSIAVSEAEEEPLDIQETSMRYMNPFDHNWGFQPIQIRKKAGKNRQSSAEEFTGKEAEKINQLINNLMAEVEYVHRELLHLGAANESARQILPMATTTRFFLSGSCRSWIHYLQQRLDMDAQLEHRQVAQEIEKLFIEHFPTVHSVLKECGDL